MLIFELHFSGMFNLCPLLLIKNQERRVGRIERDGVVGQTPIEISFSVVDVFNYTRTLRSNPKGGYLMFPKTTNLFPKIGLKLRVSYAAALCENVLQTEGICL